MQSGVATASAAGVAPPSDPDRGDATAVTPAAPTVEQVMASIKTDHARAAGRAAPVAAGVYSRPRAAVTNGKIGRSYGGRRDRRPLLVLVAFASVIAAAAAVAATVMLTVALGPSYTAQVRTRMMPVIQANRQLAGVLGTLSATHGASRALASARVTRSAVRLAQSEVGKLTPASRDLGFADRANRALRSELAWLNAVVAVLRHPGSPMASRLASLGADTGAKLAAIDPPVPGAAASFPGSARVITYAHRHSSAVVTRRALIRFSDRVQGLLDQSAPAYQEINQLWAELQAPVTRGAARITPAQGTATIATVVATRTSLAASARTLAAPNPLAASVRAALVAALDARLTSDQDVSACLSQTGGRRFAATFQSCLTATAARANAATGTEQHFYAQYNRLRRQVGLLTTNVVF